MKKKHNSDAELAMIELMYASAEIAQSPVFSGPIMRALEHVERAIKHLQRSPRTRGLEKSSSVRRNVAA